MKLKFIIRSLFPSNKFINRNLRVQVKEGTNVSKQITEMLPDLENAVNLTRSPMTIISKGENATLMNFGAETAYFKNDELQSKIAAQVYNHIYKVKSYK